MSDGLVRKVRWQSMVAYFSMFAVASGFYMYFAIILLLTIAVIYSVCTRTLLINSKVSFILLFVLFHTYISATTITVSGVIHGFAMFFMYWCALQLSSERINLIDELSSVISISCGFLFHLVYTIILNFQTGYIFTNAYLVNPVTGEYLAPTHYSVMVYLPLCLAFFFLMNQDTNKIFKILFSTVTFICAMICVFMLARRMVLVALAILLMYRILVGLRKKEYSRNQIFFLSITVILVIFFLLFNWGKIENLIVNSYFGQRFQSTDFSDSGRLVRVQYYLDHFLDHIWGGNNLYAVKGYAHNLWLDVYDKVGVIPFIMLVAFCISSIKSTLYYCKIEVRQRKTLFMMILIVSMLHYFTEPAYYSIIEFVWCVSLMTGTLDGKIHNYKYLVLGNRK